MTEAVIVVDANVLLDLYRLSRREREQVLDALRAVGDRAWLPYQAGLEYHRNRLAVIRGRSGVYEELRKIAGLRSHDEMRDRLNGLGLPDEIVDQIRDELGALHTQLDRAMSEFRTLVGHLEAEQIISGTEAVGVDPVRDALNELFDGRTGARPDEDVRRDQVKEALRRIESETPPGYKDAGKKSDEQRAGDYLVWCEVLDKAAEANEVGQALVFVTSDAKEDWYGRSQGAPLGPRPQLTRELRRRSAQGYHQVPLQEFLALAKEHLGVGIDESTIDRTKDLEGAIVPGASPGGPALSKQEISLLQELLSTRELSHDDVDRMQDALNRANSGDPDALRFTVDSILSRGTNTSFRDILYDRWQRERRSTHDTWRPGRRTESAAPLETGLSRPAADAGDEPDGRPG